MKQFKSKIGIARLSLLSLFLFALVCQSHAQVKDSKGTDFWLTFPGNFSPGSETMSFFISSAFSTSGTVAAPGTGYSVPFSVTPGNVTTIVLPANLAVNSSDVIANNGIHVTSLQEVTVYGLNRQVASTDAYLALPTDAIGTKYINLGFGNTGIVSGTQFGIVATQNNTTVTIIPTITTGVRTAGVPYNIVLNQGQTYLLRNASNASGDLSGSSITADKPIAVFGSHQCANIPNSNYTFCDYVVEQLVPTEAWGKNFVSVPLKTRLNGDTFRFLASEDNTTVKVNGVTVATLNARQYSQSNINGFAQITSDKPILVAQYSNSTSFDAVISDPFMMIVFPFEQFLNGYTVSTPASGFRFNFINVAAPAAAVGAIQLDGVAIPAASYTPIGATGYSGAQLTVGLGVHTLGGTALPFGVGVYGFDNADSYGYPGGGTFAPIASVTNVTIAPKTGTGEVCVEKCFTATVKDGQNNPLVGVRVDFNITGANPGSTGFANTNSNGIATFCYTGPNTGIDNIAATVGTVSDGATFTWTACTPVATTIAISPKTGTDKVCNSNCFSALVKDQLNAPISGKTVQFTITGANPGSSGSAVTNALGIATFCYAGPNVGNDNITASADALSDAASFVWTTCQTQECDNPIDRLYVDASVGVSGSGGTWVCAMKELRDAIAYANTHPAIQSIWVADGTYRATAGAIRAASMIITRANLKILGGFAGGEVNEADANPVANPTIISGEIGAAGNADNSYHPLTVRGLALNANPLVIDGFTVTGGNANAAGGGNNYGGGLIAYSNNIATPIRIARTRFADNNSSTYGGGIYADRTSIQFEGCTFAGNSSASGGGMYGFVSSSQFNKTVFVRNNASASGGGYYGNFGSLLFSKTAFASNTSTVGGGGVYLNQANADFANCVISGNSSNHGGGVYQHNNSITRIVNSTFSNNAAVGPSFPNGGALALGMPLSQTGIANSIFAGNTKAGADNVPGADILNFFPGSNMPNGYGFNILQANSAVPADNGSNIVSNQRGVNPMFTNPASAVGADGTWFTADDGLQLQAGSPAVNTGNNLAATTAGLTQDILDMPRIACEIVDLGAYEKACVGGPARNITTKKIQLEEKATATATGLVSNPFSSDLQIRYTGTEKCAASIYDGNGRVMVNGRSILQGTNHVDAGSWTRGMYQVVLSTASGKKMIFKAMKL